MLKCGCSSRFAATETMTERQHPSAGQACASDAKPYPTSDFQLEDRPLDDIRSLRVTVVGAGLSGILAGILLPVKVPGIELTILEKNSDVVSRVPSCSYLAVLIERNFLIRVGRGLRTPIPALDAMYRPMSTKVHLHQVPNGLKSMPKAPRFEVTGRTWLGSMVSTAISNWAVWSR